MKFWSVVQAKAETAIAGFAHHEPSPLDSGQTASLRWIAKRINQGGLVLADEVGTGKTRIACALIQAALKAGGRAVVLAPHGLMHQWRAESLKLDPDFPPPKLIATLGEYLRSEPAEADRPSPDDPEWWIVSHGFRAPSVSDRSDDWRVVLPALTETYLARKELQSDRRTRYGRLLTAVEEDLAGRIRWRAINQVALDIARRARGDRALRRQLLRLDWFDPMAQHQPSFGEEHRIVVEQLLRHWLGPFDLVVIDEAHKSRSQDEIDRTVLSRLLNRIILPRDTTRRLCVTATPIELDPIQWIDVIKRAEANFNAASVELAIADFTRGRDQAVLRPDEGSSLNELCRTARNFQKALQPFVTRQLRSQDSTLAKFGIATGRPHAHHPHRRVVSVPIELSPSDIWLEQVFAAECMRASLNGVSGHLPARQAAIMRRAGAWLASGHVSEDMGAPAIADVGLGSTTSERRKLARVDYWRQQLRSGQFAGTEPPFDRLATHPRLLAAVREIETWTARGEKVLVFGVFLQPLRLLRDILNIRHALRLVRDNQPVPQALHRQPGFLQLAMQQIDLLPSGSPQEISAILGRELAEQHRAYERLRQRLRTRAKFIQGLRRTSSILGSVAPDRKLDNALQEHLVTFVLEAQLRGRVDLSSEGAQFDNFANAFVKSHVQSLLTTDDAKSRNSDHSERAHAVLREVFVDEGEGRLSFHARLMEGSTGWETRRYIQAAFNNPDASPQVLIAQSMVGREGLNLHEACRVIVQFHAEWNPAVLEQQVGRVDRKQSKWERLAEDWLRSDRAAEPPYIEIRRILFEGTYDALQWARVARREHSFNASLFGVLLPPDAWDRLPDDRATELRNAAPQFTP